MRVERYNRLKAIGVVLLVGLILLLGYNRCAHAARTINTLPWSESFNSNNYSDLVWVTQGATQTYVPTGGWNHSGGAKFVGPRSEGYAALGQFLLASNIQPRQLNVRFLIYHGRTWSTSGSGGKLLTMNQGGRNRPMLVYGNVSGVDSLAPCDGTVCAYRNQPNGQIDLSSYWADGRERFKIGNGTNGRSHEWICIEAEANTVTRRMTLYIDTQDGAFRDVYLTRPMTDSAQGGVWSYIDFIGTYTNSGERRAGDPESYFIIDEVALATSRIGPPAGFRGSPPPVQLPAPTNVRVE